MKWLTYVCVLLVSLGTFSGCEHADPEKPRHVAILLFGDSRQPQADGFMEGMAELGYEESRNIRYTVFNAQNDRSKLEPFIQDMINENVDLLVPCGGLESDATRKLLSDTSIPVVNAYNNTIVERGLVKSRREPGWNITGVDSLSAEISGKRIQLIHDLIPDARRVLILYYERIAPSRLGVQYAREQAGKLGMEIDARAVASRDDVQEVMNSLRPGDVDAMLMVPTAPIDNMLKELILPNVQRLGLPLVAHSRPLAESGALASYGASFFEMGKQASRLADKVMRGVPASSLPFETPKRFNYVVNRPVMERLGISLTELSKSQINEFIGQD
jgi:putative ABC transport system substrate-binding protein